MLENNAEHGEEEICCHCLSSNVKMVDQLDMKSVISRNIFRKNQCHHKNRDPEFA